MDSTIIIVVLLFLTFSTIFALIFLVYKDRHLAQENLKLLHDLVATKEKLHIQFKKYKKLEIEMHKVNAKFNELNLTNRQDLSKSNNRTPNNKHSKRQLLISELSDKLAKGKIEEVLSNLRSYSELMKDQTLIKMSINLSSRYNLLRKKKVIGILNNNEIEKAESNIVNSISIIFELLE